jgi:hypothetical protein
MQPTAEHLMQGLERRARKGFQGYPLGIVAFYGYNDKVATKAVIGIVNSAGGSPEKIRKWVFEHGDLRKDVPSIKELFRYLEANNTVSVALTPGIYYCPHEPGVDFPPGESCPQCSFWSHVKKPDLFRLAKAALVKDRPGEILARLTEAARSRKTLTYGDVMQAMGLAYKDAEHRQLFKKDLRTAVQQSESYSHGLLISVLLVLRIQNIAEDDFFLMAQELGQFTPGVDSKTVFYKEHLERVFNYYDGK